LLSDQHILKLSALSYFTFYVDVCTETISGLLVNKPPPEILFTASSSGKQNLGYIVATEDSAYRIVPLNI
jgi:hypothetical protein